jgi:alpha-beta hydrolase superfamily lysophospholipase
LNAPALGCRPIHFGPAERALFGWYHAPQGAPRDCGVLLCNPIGDDYVRAHRPLRHLAEMLARAGFGVLRFDFHGTGDSSGTERDRERVAAWIADVHLATDELRARTSAARVAIVGLRLGATIGAWACKDRPVDDLVLWNPYVGGSAYVADTTRLHKMLRLLEPQSFAAEPPGWNGGGQEALGFLLTPETVADLRPIDLLAAQTRLAQNTLVIGAASPSLDQKLLEHLRGLGGAVDYENMPGHNFLVQINHCADLPTAVLEEITRWLGERHPPRDATDRRPAPTAPEGTMPYGEQPVVFGRAHPLFGILVHPPKGKLDPKRPVIIMTNAGCVHRIGPHRFYVTMARRWAALGFRVLRIDLSGIGDSPVAPGCPENVTYPRDGLEDLDDAMTAVGALTGAERFIVLGLCSGGDLAFQIGFKDPRVASAVMMNPRTFCVHDLEMVDSYQRARHYQDSFFRLESWKKALRGEVNVRRALGLVAPKVKDLVRKRLARVIPQPAEKQNGAKHNDVPACLRMMAERGVDTFLVASEKDPGVDFVDIQFGKAMQSLKGVRGYRREDFMGVDHTFTSLYAQEKVSQVLTDHFVALVS